MEKEKYTNIHYQNYLGLDKILDAQNPRSGVLNENPAHEEMLFIIVHQVYELWFKQIIHELDSVVLMFQDNKIDERNIGRAVSRLNRVIEIQKLLISQIGIMETMTPLDFLDFRNYLFPASGFQSFQFRKIENLLGLQEDKRLTYNGCPYSSVFNEDQQQQLTNINDTMSLFDATEDWLERTPFLELGDYRFLDHYQTSVQRMISKEQSAISKSTYLSESEKNQRLRMLGDTNTYFQSVLEPGIHQKLQERGELRLSHKATVAALLINLYRDEPILHQPFKYLTCLIDIDELMTSWRYRHAQMVLRMLGNKIGTGGSSGHSYLHKTAEKHHIFKDLHGISTLLIPRSELPELPDSIVKNLGFYFKSNK